MSCPNFEYLRNDVFSTSENMMSCLSLKYLRNDLQDLSSGNPPLVFEQNIYPQKQYSVLNTSQYAYSEDTTLGFENQIANDVFSISENMMLSLKFKYLRNGVFSISENKMSCLNFK